MKYKIRQSGKAEKIIEVHISRELVASELERIYSEISKTASLSGYRVGKAPVDVVKKRYKKEATDDAVKNLLVDSINKAIKESNVEVLGPPQISDLQFDEERGMSYKAAVNIKPQPKLKEYKGLTLKSAKKEIKESDIDVQINTIREINAKFLTKEGGAEEGDYIVCDVECRVEENPLEKKENVWLYVGDDAFIPGKSLVGLNVSEEKDVEKILPKDYSKKEVAGKKANFHVKVKEIKKKIVPELNDDFAATAGNFRSMAELREAVRESIKEKNKKEERRELENQAIRILDKTASFEVPQSIVDKHLETLVEDTKQKLVRERYSDDEIKSMDKNIRDRLKEEALRQIRVYFILGEIAKLENISADDKDLEEAFNAIASTSGRSLGEIKKYYGEKELIGDMKEEIKQKKALDFIIANARIK